jgi:putative GTP pyrophosphokinase
LIMDEDKLVARWNEERPIYEAWGQHVIKCVSNALEHDVPFSADAFLRIPPKPRLKTVGSFIDKAFYREKLYSSPYEDITDKVGVRFVVLLVSQIKDIESVVESCLDWTCTKDKDFEKEQREYPKSFDYAATHYVVKNRNEFESGGLKIPIDIPCEIQIKSLLQFAAAELTHDLTYKPQTSATPTMVRMVAKSIALTEATEDYFQRLRTEADKLETEKHKLLAELTSWYIKIFEKNPETTKISFYLLDKLYPNSANLTDISEVIAFIEKNKFVVQKIELHARSSLLFRQPIIPLIYFLVYNEPTTTKSNWPISDNELKNIYADLGKSVENF